MLYSQNLQKQTHKFFQNGGGGGRVPGAPVQDPPFQSISKCKMNYTGKLKSIARKQSPKYHKYQVIM